MAMVKTIFKRLFRVYAHIYHSHFQMILALGLGIPSEHLFQALHLLHRRVHAGGVEGAGSPLLTHPAVQVTER
jgi:hypothetical protein